jgi:hypothetical protein
MNNLVTVTITESKLLCKYFSFFQDSTVVYGTAKTGHYWATAVVLLLGYRE